VKLEVIYADTQKAILQS